MLAAGRDIMLHYAQVQLSRQRLQRPGLSAGVRRPAPPDSSPQRACWPCTLSMATDTHML